MLMVRMNVLGYLNTQSDTSLNQENAVAANQTRASTGEIAHLSEQLKELIEQFKI